MLIHGFRTYLLAESQREDNYPDEQVEEEDC